MTKQPLTPTGVQDLLTELYGLSPTAIQVEAIAIQGDFKAWIKTNFTLSTKQEDYLDDLNKQAADYFGSQCSVCFSSKLPIDLIYPAPPTGEYSKWTGTPQNNLAVKTDGEGKPVATGSLTFEFSYTTV